MGSYRIDPYVAGRLALGTDLDASTHPPTVTRLHYEFEQWPGMDIVGSFPCFLVTERLAVALSEAALSGVAFDRVVVTVDPQMRRFFPAQAKSLPAWRWLRPSHVSDADVQLDSEAFLVVSERAMEVLRGFDLSGAEVTRQS